MTGKYRLQFLHKREAANLLLCENFKHQTPVNGQWLLHMDTTMFSARVCE